jgi:hypothetical protein
MLILLFILIVVVVVLLGVSGGGPRKLRPKVGFAPTRHERVYNNKTGEVLYDTISAT